MQRLDSEIGHLPYGSLIFRIALFTAAASLAAYIPFKYATQLNTIEGFYAFLFPLSGILALVGMGLAIKPRLGCDCGFGLRSGVGAVALLWLATGVLCVPTLVAMIPESPWGGAIAAFHMIAQHIFLSFAILAFAFAPNWMARKLGVDDREVIQSIASDSALQA